LYGWVLREGGVGKYLMLLSPFIPAGAALKQGVNGFQPSIMEDL